MSELQNSTLDESEVLELCVLRYLLHERAQKQGDQVLKMAKPGLSSKPFTKFKVLQRVWHLKGFDKAIL